MNRFIKLVTAMLLLGAVATASTVGGSSEVFTNVTKGSNSMDTANGRCDSLERLLGMCRSSEDILTKQ